MTRTWFDRCYGELLMADAVQRDPRLTALWEAEDCTAVKEGSGNSVQQYIMAHGRGAEPTLKTSEVMDGTGVSVQQLVDMHRRGDVTLSYWSGTPQSWPGRTEQMIAQRGSSMVPWDGKVDLDGRLYGWVRVPADAMAKLKECDDMTAKTEEAAGVLNTFSTKGSLNIPMKVEKVGSKYYVIYTSGAIVDWDLPPFSTYGEALAAAKRLAAEEGVRVEEAEGQGTAEQVFAVLRKGAATVEMVADEIGITAEQAQRVLDNLQARAMIRRRGDRYFMDQFA